MIRYRNALGYLLGILLLSPLALISQTGPDLSILQRVHELSRYMTPHEQLKIARLSKSVADAESDVRTGLALTNSEGSRLQRDRETESIKAKRQRGEELIKEADAAKAAAWNEAAILLIQVDERLKKQSRLEAMKFDFSIERTNFEEAQNTAVSTILQATKEAGYNTILYDKSFVTTASGTHPVSPELRKSTYTSLLYVEGDIPVIHQPESLGLSDAPENRLFHFKHADKIYNSKSALLAIEIIPYGNAGEGILLARALDLKSLRVIKHSFKHITGLDTLLEQSTSTLDGSNNILTIPEFVKIFDSDQWINRFASLPKPYQFEITTEGTTPTVEDILAKNALAHSLLERSTIILIDSSFVNRAYGATEKTVADLASASFTLKGGMGMYEIVAQARNNPRMIEIGTITLEGNKNDQS
ncbi:MAG: hypothetical protein AAF065_04465 [Verrucomicrobiota bacterium]